MTGQRVGAPSVHVSEDFAPFGGGATSAVRAALGEVPLVATGSPYLVSPGRVTKDDGTPYKVFTPFCRAWREHGWRGPAQTGREVGAVARSATLEEGGEAGDIPDPGRRLDLPAGEAAARQAWKGFVDDGLTATRRTATGPTSTASAGCRRT